MGCLFNLQKGPQDISFVGAIGDSDTAGYASRDINLFSFLGFTDYIGTSFATGLDGTNPSLASLVQMCNPNVKGGSTGGISGLGLPGNGDRGLNVAVSGAVSADIEEQARTLVNLTMQMPYWQKKWKLVPIYIGGNDIYSCSDDGIDTYTYAMNVKRALNVLQFLPKTYVVLVGLPDFTQLNNLRDSNFFCGLFLGFYTSGCNLSEDKQRKLVYQFNQQLQKISNMYKYMRDDFTVEYTPAVTNVYNTISTNELAVDCFHFNTRGQGQIAVNIWNSLFQPRGARTPGNYVGNAQPTCPNDYMPFLATKQNS